MKKLIRLTESDLKRIVKNTVKRIIREDFSDDEDLKDYHTFTPNRSKYYRDETEDNYMGGIGDDDSYDKLGNKLRTYDEGEDDWHIGDEVPDNGASRYNNALQRQQKSNREVERLFRNSPTAWGYDEFGRKCYHGTHSIPDSDYEIGYDNMYKGKNEPYSFEEKPEDDYDEEPDDRESGWDENYDEWLKYFTKF